MGAGRGEEGWGAKERSEGDGEDRRGERRRAQLVLCSRELEEGDVGKEGRRSFWCTREDKGGARRTRIAGMIDAWRRLAYGRRRAQEKHSNAFDQF